MAKVTINADTESDALEVLIDGKTVENVNSISIYMAPSWYERNETELSLCITTYSEDEDSGIKTMTNLTARDNKEAKKLQSAGAKVSQDFKDFIETNKSNKIKLDIEKYFGVSN